MTVGTIEQPALRDLYEGALALKDPTVFESTWRICYNYGLTDLWPQANGTTLGAWNGKWYPGAPMPWEQVSSDREMNDE